MMKIKNVLTLLSILVCLMCSCLAPTVEIKNIANSLNYEKKGDYTADSATIMSSVKKWYSKNSEKETISFSVKNEKGEKTSIFFQVPMVKADSITSDTDIAPYAQVSAIPIRITHRSEVFFNGLEVSAPAIVGGFDVVRDMYARPVVVYLNVDKDADFATYLNVKNVIYQYIDQVSTEYFEKPYSKLKQDEREKLQDVFKLYETEYIYDRHKVNTQWSKINID